MSVMIGVFFLMLVGLAGLVVLGLIVAAIASKRLWPALAAVGLIVLGPALLLVPMYFTVSSSVPSQSSIAHTFDAGPSWLALIMVVLLVVGGFVAVSKCLSPSNPDARPRLGWVPVLLVAFFAALLVLGGMRFSVRRDVQSASHQHQILAQEAARQMEDRAARIQEQVQRHAQHLEDQANRAADRAHEAMSIDEYWDRTTAPRIELEPSSVRATAAQAQIASASTVAATSTATPWPLTFAEAEKILNGEESVENTAPVADDISATEAPSVPESASVADAAEAHAEAATASTVAAEATEAVAEKPQHPGGVPTDSENRVVEAENNTAPSAHGNLDTRRRRGGARERIPAAAPETSIWLEFDANRLRLYDLSLEQAIDAFQLKPLRIDSDNLMVEFSSSRAGELDHKLRATRVEVRGGTINLRTVATIRPARGNSEPSPTQTTARPAWIDDPPKRVGHNWREVLVTDEFVTAEECYEQADRMLLLATHNHLQMLAGNYGERTGRLLGGPGHSLPSGDPIIDELARIGITIDYVRREIARREHLESTSRLVGPMIKLSTEIEFTPAVNRHLKARWSAGERDRRLATVGLGAGSILGLLGLTYGLLKADTWTKGYYTKRLFLGVPAAIMALAALAALIA